MQRSAARLGRRLRRAGDAVEMLQVLADGLRRRLRIDQLIAGRHAEQGGVLLAALQ